MNAPADAAQRYLRPGTLSLRELPPLSLYVHLPWCLRKCPYCDFNSHEARREGAPEAGGAPRPPGPAPLLEPALERRYLQALCADLESALPLVWGRRVTSVFIGGGTPSLFSPEGIAQLVADVRARLTLVPDCEVTLEANPGTFEAERFRAFRAAGVTRLSIGVQSFDDEALARIGRVHDGAQARAAVAEAARAFDTFNIDLMYALPGQTLEALARELDTALAFAPPHLSIYHLTLEPNTVFATRPPEGLPDEDLSAQMLDLITARMEGAGLSRYEVSAFARAGHRCRHNLNYWQFGDYLGIGAGAHSKVSFPARILRQARLRQPAGYMAGALHGAPLAESAEVRRGDLGFEFMLNALRLADGVPSALFGERTGYPLAIVARELEEGVRRGLLDPDPSRIVATPLGQRFLNQALEPFLPRDDARGAERRAPGAVARASR